MTALAHTCTFGGTDFRFWLSQPTAKQDVRSYTPSHSKLDRGYVVTLSSLMMPSYMLVRPLTIAVEQDEEGMFLASDSVTTVYGYDDTGTEALADYMLSLVEYYDLLEESDSLTTVSALDSLRKYLTKKTS